MIQDSPISSNKNIDLPIIHKLIETYKIWQEFLPHFPKTSRYSLGAKIDTAFLETIELIFGSCSMVAKEKLPLLNKSSTKLDLLKFLLRIAWEIKSLDNKKFILISERLDEIGKMLGGWINHLKEKLPPSAGE